MVNDIWSRRLPVLCGHLQAELADLEYQLLLLIAAHGYTATTGATGKVFDKNILQLHNIVPSLPSTNSEAKRPPKVASTIAPTSASESPTSASRSRLGMTCAQERQ